MARRNLWLIAAAIFLVGILISGFTPYKLLLLFLPLVFAPVAFRRRDGDGDSDNDSR